MSRNILPYSALTNPDVSVGTNMIYNHTNVRLIDKESDIQSENNSEMTFSRKPQKPLQFNVPTDNNERRSTKHDIANHIQNDINQIQETLNNGCIDTRKRPCQSGKYRQCRHLARLLG